MLDENTIRDMVAEGYEAAEAGVELRATLRRASDPADPERRKQLHAAVRRLRKAMYPVRRALGQLPYLPVSSELEAELRAVSDTCQRERRKLRKMLQDPVSTRRYRGRAS